MPARHAEDPRAAQMRFHSSSILVEALAASVEVHA
jgi:hypothetical protein